MHYVFKAQMPHFMVVVVGTQVFGITKIQARSADVITLTQERTFAFSSVLDCGVETETGPKRPRQ